MLIESFKGRLFSPLITCMEITSDVGVYLGLPLFHNRISQVHFNSIIDKMHANLASWKTSFLPMAGRTVLTKSVISAIPVYALQAIPIPYQVCYEMDKIVRIFLWGHSSSSKKWHAVKWETVFKS